MPPCYTASMASPRPLEHMSTPALCFAFGSCTRAPSERDHARILMLAEELQHRGELTDLVASLEPDLARALGAVYTAARVGLRYGSAQHRRPTLDEPPALGLP